MPAKVSQTRNKFSPRRHVKARLKFFILTLLINSKRLSILYPLRPYSSFVSRRALFIHEPLFFFFLISPRKEEKIQDHIHTAASKIYFISAYKRLRQRGQSQLESSLHLYTSLRERKMLCSCSTRGPNWAKEMCSVAAMGLAERRKFFPFAKISFRLSLYIRMPVKSAARAYSPRESSTLAPAGTS